MKTTITRGDAARIYGWLNSIILTKFTKETRKFVISSLRSLKAIATQLGEDEQEAQKKLFAGHEDALEKRSALVAEFNSTNNLKKRTEIAEKINLFVELQPLDKELAEMVEAMHKESVEVELMDMNEENFIEECADAEIGLSGRTLDMLAPLFK